MAIWSIADLHLSFGVPNKKMDIFGSQWMDHPEKIAEAWHTAISPTDLVLIPGDISWALHLEEVKPDLIWLEKLPGTKVFIKGNHDYWWGPINKIKQVLPPSCHLIQNDSFKWKDISIGGSRMWDSAEYNFDRLFEDLGPGKLTQTDSSDESVKIFRRELGRLEMSLRTLDPKAHLRIAMTHYPPIGLDLKDSDISRLLEKYGVQICVFGHLHNVKPDLALFGTHHGIAYHLVACDHLQFKPLKIVE